MPTISFDDTTGTCLVEFRLPPEAVAEQAWLAGDFNDWSTDACPLEQRDDGSLAVVLELEPGRSYRFRYYLGDGAWENDWAADAYVGNDHGGADSVVIVPAPPGSASAGPPPVSSPGEEPEPYPTGEAGRPTADGSGLAGEVRGATTTSTKKAAAKNDPGKKASAKKADGVKKAAKKKAAPERAD